MGSAGLFAERADAKMPYIDRGYVQETTSDGIPIKKKQESAPAAPNPFAGFQNPFEKKEASAPAPAPAPAPAAPELPNPFAAFFDKPKTPEPEPAPEPEAPNRSSSQARSAATSSSGTCIPSDESRRCHAHGETPPRHRRGSHGEPAFLCQGHLPTARRRRE